MNYGDVEIAISDYINSKLVELELQQKFFAAPMPETDKQASDYDAQLAVKTCVAVEFLDTSFQENSALGFNRHVENAKFRLLFGGKKMRGPDGLFAFIAHCKKFLIGYTLPDSKESISLSQFGRQHFEPGFWLPFIDIEIKMVNSQVVEPDYEIIGGEFQGLETI